MRGRRLEDAQVTVTGMGLMGGSLAASLMKAQACRRIVGVARRQEAAAQVTGMRIVHEATCNLADGVREADIVVLATPVRTIIEMIGEIGAMLPDGCVLTDLGSTKGGIVQAMENLPAHVQPVGGHPMCGKVSGGLTASSAGLYAGATYVLTPLERTGEEALSLAHQLVVALGARPIVLDAARHDLLVAVASHVPHVVSTALVMAAESAGDEAVWDVAARGFRDMSRLAATDGKMLMDILFTNRSEVLAAMARFEQHMMTMRRMLEVGDEAGLAATMELAGRRRSGWRK